MPLRYRLLALLLLCLSAPAWAQADAPVLGVLVLDEHWDWTPERQKELRVPAAPGLVTDWKALLSPRACAALDDAQKAALLADPRRLLASRHTAEILATPRLLLIGPEQEGRVSALHVDLATGARRVLQGPEDQGEDEARAALVASALASEAPLPVPVVANPASGLYHRPGAPHLSPNNPAVDLPDRSDAEARGYSPCAICFPEENRLFQGDDFERELGRYGAQVVESRYRVSQDPRDRERVNAVGRRVMETNRLNDQGYRFVVLDSDEINAMAVPTGPVYITSGMLRVLETDDELAAVLGHELGHNEQHHMLQQYDRNQWMGILGAVIGATTRSYWARQAGGMMANLLSTGFSRDFELEADREGVLLSYGAGYRPEDFILTLKKLEELATQTGRIGPDWLRTHPDEDGRIRQVEEMLERLQPLDAAIRGLEARGDGELAACLRRQARTWLERPAQVQAFLSAYDRLQFSAGTPIPIEVVPGSGETGSGPR